MAEPFMAQIVMFGGNFAPRGWALCDGQLLPIAQNSALFSLLGTTYGGDGRTTFGLPDLRGRSPKHAGSGPGLRHIRQGERGGRETHTMSVYEMPSHSHTAVVQAKGGVDADATGPKNKMFGRSSANMYTSAVAGGNLIQMSNDSVAVGNAGGGQGFSIEDPYLGVNFIIALQGVFPSRS